MVMGMGASALIIARPEPLRDGLHALVGTMPQIGSVDVVSDVHSALKSDIGGPALLLLDAGLTGNDVWLTLRRAKARWPGARIIVLVDTVQQQAEAEAAGADVVLLEGFPAGRLVAAIVKLLPQPIM
jgi:DNA-binding NarL/FixJ family response regulator